MTQLDLDRILALVKDIRETLILRLQAAEGRITELDGEVETLQRELEEAVVHRNATEARLQVAAESALREIAGRPRALSANRLVR
jgi:hypothetical protein